MKLLVFLSILSIIHCRNGISQDSARLFLNTNFELVENKKDAKIIRDALIANGRYYIADQYVNGNRIMSGEYKSVNPWVEDGPFVYYDKDGELYAKGFFKNGDMTGEWVYYDSVSTDTVNYDEALSLFEKATKSKSNDPITEAPVELIEYLLANSHFPPRLLNIYPESVVNIEISIDKEKNIVPMIQGNTHRDFKFEALRTLLSAPDSIFYSKTETGRTNTFYSFWHNFKGTIPQEAISDGSSDWLDTSEVYVFVEEQASFLGGDLEDFREWVQKNVVYPTEAIINGEYGRATVKFVVTESGKVANLKILRSSSSKSIDREVFRVIMSSPLWKPARNKGKAVIQQFVMPVIFQLQ